MKAEIFVDAIWSDGHWGTMKRTLELPFVPPIGMLLFPTLQMPDKSDSLDLSVKFVSWTIDTETLGISCDTVNCGDFSAYKSDLEWFAEQGFFPEGKLTPFPLQKNS